MPKIVIPLNDVKIKGAKAKAYKLADGGGTYLEVTPAGGKLWRMKYRQAHGKENRLSFGRYPETTLIEARAERTKVRKLLSDGIDPAVDRDNGRRIAAEKSANTFEKLAC